MAVTYHSPNNFFLPVQYRYTDAAHSLILFIREWTFGSSEACFHGNITIHRQKKNGKKCKPRHKKEVSDQCHDPAALFPTSKTYEATWAALSVGIV
jgi:hypothetical protein